MHLFMHRREHGGHHGGHELPTRRRVVRRTGMDTEQHARVRALDAGRHQLGRLHHVRVQLLQAEDEDRLAHARHLLGVHRRAVRRDVRLPADDLPAVRMARAPGARDRSARARLRASLVLAARIQGRSALEPDPHREQPLHPRRVRSAVRLVARSVRGPASGQARDDRAVSRTCDIPSTPGSS